MCQNFVANCKINDKLMWLIKIYCKFRYLEVSGQQYHTLKTRSWDYDSSLYILLNEPILVWMCTLFVAKLSHKVEYLKVTFLVRGHHRK